MGITATAGAKGAPAKTPAQHSTHATHHTHHVTKHVTTQKSVSATKVGGTADASKGANALGGGGTDLSAALDALKASLQSLAEAVQKLSGTAGGGPAAAADGCGSGGCGGSHGVLAAQGTAATKAQFVAPKVVPINTGKKEDNAFEQRVLELINQERAKYGLGAVKYSGVLDNAAEKHADHMAIVGKMAHEGIGDGDPGERIRAEGFRNSWGENVATGQTSPEQVVREWMASPEHRRNILDPNYRQMGVSYVNSASGRSYWAQEFGA
jgi:uncharacterized protein YkwD